MHPGWEFVTWQDPIPPEGFVTAPLWHHCTTGAQLAGLIRLDDLWARGGVYVDADVECYRPFDPLLGTGGFAAWEDERVVPDAVLGAEAGHPAIEECLSLAMALVAGGRGAWESGPGVTTGVLPGREDWLLLPPGAFYPYHYSGLHRKPPTKAALLWRHNGAEMARLHAPWCFCIHHWAKSWIPTNR